MQHCDALKYCSVPSFLERSCSPTKKQTVRYLLYIAIEILLPLWLIITWIYSVISLSPIQLQLPFYPVVEVSLNKPRTILIGQCLRSVKQWAAVMIHRGWIREAPHLWYQFPATLYCISAIHGQEWEIASRPPITRRKRGRWPHSEENKEHSLLKFDFLTL